MAFQIEKNFLGDNTFLTACFAGDGLLLTHHFGQKT